MKEFRITSTSKAKDLEDFALALHSIIKLPLVIRSLNEKGIRIENEKIIDDNYTGPILEKVLKENKLIKTIPTSGAYMGKSTIVAPIRDEDGAVIAAIGISDTYGAFDFIECFCRNPNVVEEVEKCMIKRLQNKGHLGEKTNET